MYRRQYLQAAGALGGAAALAGCGSFGGTNGNVAPGVSTDGVDSATVASTARDRLAAAPYSFEWRTEGNRLGTNFFQAIHEREEEQLLLRSREGGAYFVDFYASGEAYRNTVPDDPTAEDRFEVPDRDRSDLAGILPAAIEQIVNVWVSGYEYGAIEELEAGVRLDIVGGQSQVPYRFDDAGGSLLVSGDGVIRDLQVAGTPVNDMEGEPTPLDTHMEAQLTLKTDDINLVKPDWIATARQSV